MDDTDRDDRLCVYEIGYLLAGMPEERVGVEADELRGIITGAGAAIIAEEAPKHEKLAYTMRKKTVAGSYDKYDEAHFGWVKFEIGSDKIEALKKAVETKPSVLRMLLVSTVKENTYLGKRAPAVTFGRRPTDRDPLAPAEEATRKEVPPANPATVEEMDKSIDDMVKEA